MRVTLTQGACDTTRRTQPNLGTIFHISKVMKGAQYCLCKRVFSFPENDIHR